MSGKVTGMNLIGTQARETVRSSRRYSVSPLFQYRPSFLDFHASCYKETNGARGLRCVARS